MNAQRADISVVIPVYNRRAQVVSAIESVFAQTIPIKEIIVVDDGSSDGSAEALRLHYGSRIKVLQQENAGVSAARNTGIRAAKGEWVALLDSDDIWLPTKIEQQLQVLRRFGSNYGVCFSDNRFGGNPEMTWTAFDEAGFKPGRYEGDFDNATWRLLRAREPFFTSSLLISRRLLIELGGFDDSLVVGEDADIVFRLSVCTRFCYASDILVEVDRTPSRNGLCNLYSTRDDRKYESFERRYTKWLSMPQVIGGEYEEPIRRMLREFRFDSVEAKLHQFRLVPAMRVTQRLAKMGDGYAGIVLTLLRRKLAKLALRSANRNRAPQAALTEKEGNAL